MYLLEYSYHLKKLLKSIQNDHLKYRSLLNILKKQKLTTYFQPILDIQTNRLIGYEALNRPTPTKAFPTTDKFYDYLGKSSHAFAFDLHCRNLSIKRFYEETLNHPEQSKPLLFINVHPNVLMDKHYQSGETRQILRQHNIEPHQVIFELTEKQAVTDFDMFKKVLENYRKQGFRIAIDDAGTGFNSLQTLVHLKPEFIKFDRSLIHQIHMNPTQQKMVQLLIEFANDTNTIVLAEGIESDLDLYFLRNLGVHLGQGYRLGMPATHFSAL